MFKNNTGHEIARLALLRRSFNFDLEWLVLVMACVVPTGKWEGIDRTQEIVLYRSMVGADREVCAHILADLAESIEIL